MVVPLPPIDSEAEHVDPKTGRPSKDFYNWIKSISTQVTQGFQSLVVGNPTGGNKGFGSLNAETIYLNGQALVPAVTDPQLSALLGVVAASGATSIQPTHVARGLVLSGSGATLTIRSNATIAMPIGSAVTILSWGSSAWALAPASGVTLWWVPTAATGSRTLPVGSFCTIWKISTDGWIVSGTGLS